MLDAAVMDLQLNYMDELKKSNAQEEEAPAEEDSPAETAAGADGDEADA
jgi:hypothetical protein